MADPDKLAVENPGSGPMAEQGGDGIGLDDVLRGAAQATAAASAAGELHEDIREGSSSGFGIALGFITFVMGLALGIPLAFLAPNLVTEYGSFALAVVITVMFTLLIMLSIVFLLRDRLWRMVFRRGEVELQRFAEPLSEVAFGAADRQPERATKAARTFAEMALARYAWVSTRRWIVASITGLVAAIAALSGSALLFEQNGLLRRQQTLLEQQTELLNTQTSALLTQTDRMQDQTRLLEAQGILLEAQTETSQTQTQLAEAERNSQIGQFVIEVAAAISADRQAWLDAGRSIDEFGLESLQAATRGQIVAATLVARPYRYLAPDVPDSRDLTGAREIVEIASTAFKIRGEQLKSEAQRDQIREMTDALTQTPGFTEEFRERAAQRRTTEAHQRMVEMLAIDEVPPLPNPAEVRLIDRPRSPERGDILSLLIGNSVLDTELLSIQGADFSFAEYRRLLLPGVSFRHASLNYAVFDWTEVNQSSFRAAVGEFIRFRNATIVNSDFSALREEDIRPPFRPGDFQTLETRLAGADFSEATIVGTDMSGVSGPAVRFDNAGLFQVSFAGSLLAASGFRGAILHEVDFSQTALQSVDLEGAYVFDPAFLDRLDRDAAPATFLKARWELVEVPIDTYFQHPRWPILSNYLDDADVAGGQMFQIRRLPDPA